MGMGMGIRLGGFGLGSKYTFDFGGVISSLSLACSEDIFTPLSNKSQKRWKTICAPRWSI
jgi:hypothetical protein